MSEVESAIERLASLEKGKALPVHEFSSLVEELVRMRGVAEKARSSEGDAVEKWAANAELVKYIRTNIFFIMSTLEASADYLGRGYGIDKQKMYQSVKSLQEESLGSQ